MLEITIPGFHTLSLLHLVLDYNGTLAFDGQLIQGVREHLEVLAGNLQVHIVTADTFGQARAQVAGIDCQLSILPEENQDTGKLTYINRLGAKSTVCIGNGRNDRLMLKKAALGIAIGQGEGAAVEAIMAADIVCPDILTALGLLRSPLRLKATLRS